MLGRHRYLLLPSASARYAYCLECYLNTYVLPVLLSQLIVVVVVIVVEIALVVCHRTLQSSLSLFVCGMAQLA